MFAGQKGVRKLLHETTFVPCRPLRHSSSYARNMDCRGEASRTRRYAPHLIRNSCCSHEPDVSEVEVERHRQDLISKVFIQALVTGNIKEQVGYSRLHPFDFCPHNRSRSKQFR